MSNERTILVTGFPTNFLATRMVRKLLTAEPESTLCVVVQEKFLSRAEQLVAALPSEQRSRVQTLEGDVASMDLGLSGKEFVDLAARVDVIHHLAAASYLGVSRDIATRINVQGVREVLELATEAKHLQRLVHWSTASVSGGRRGYVLEEELAAPEGFRNVVEETRFEGERLVRRAIERGLRATVLRPSIVVGDSATGETDRLEGPYLLVMLMLNAPHEMRLPLPSRGDVPLNLVPVDYVVEAGFAISRDTRSIGRTFHIVDPAPQSARRVFEMIAQAAGRPLPRGFLPTNLATTLLRTPGVERLSHVPRGFLEQLSTEVVYDDRGAREILDTARIRCPDFESYVDVMVQYVKRQQAQKRPARADNDSERPTATERGPS